MELTVTPTWRSPSPYHVGVTQFEDFDRSNWPDVLPSVIQDYLDNPSGDGCECQAEIWGYKDGVWFHVFHACGASSVWIGGVILPGGEYQEVDDVVWEDGLEAIQI